MPPAKRAPKSSTASKPTASKPAAKKPAAKKTTPAARATATTARKSTAKTASTAKRGAGSTARAATTASKSTASTAKAGAKQTTRATGTSARSKETVTLSRGHLQEALDDAASRGRITRKDANDLVTELMRRGKATGDEVGELLGKGRTRLQTASNRVRKAEPVDRLVRGADRARRAAGVGPTFPIAGYDELNATQVQARAKELSKPDKRKVLTYERKHANRKSVVGALEKQLA